MRRKLLATSLALMALTALAPAAGADALVEEDGPYVCVRSALLLGDPICIKYYPSQNS